LEEILEIADDSSRDYVKKTGVDGTVTWVVDREHIASCALRIKTRFRTVALLAPRKYGNR
jgi:Bacteriophage Sf6, terminase small subunit-like